MSEPFLGSVEIKTNSGESIGDTGVRWTLEAVPIVLEVKYGITGMTATDPVDPRDPAVREGGPILRAQWNGLDNQMQPVTVYLWEAAPDPVNPAALAAQAAQEGTA